jgi:hypothetical protein
MKRLVRLLVALAVGLVSLAGPDGGAQTTPRPQYLPFAEFTNDDAPSHVAAKQVYNSAVEKYNKALYDYHVTLGQIDQLVELHNRAGTPVEQQEKARADAAPLRVKLQTLRRDVTSLAAAVDDARRRATQAGVTLNR